jgi:hypothetical protein
MSKYVDDIIEAIYAYFDGGSKEVKQARKTAIERVTQSMINDPDDWEVVGGSGFYRIENHKEKWRVEPWCGYQVINRTRVNSYKLKRLCSRFINNELNNRTLAAFNKIKQ